MPRIKISLILRPDIPILVAMKMGKLIIASLTAVLVAGSVASASSKAGALQSPAAGRKYPRHHRTVSLPAPDPAPVLDTTCIDAVADIQRTMVKEINHWSQVRYKKGGVTTKGADCSGFVLKVYEHSLEVQLPRTSHEQALVGDNIEKDSLAFGDLVFFYKNVRRKIKRIGHVGIYVGDGNFVHSRKHHGVGESSLSEHYYAVQFACARRIVNVAAVNPLTDDGSSASE